jgi:DNA-binding MarR family transcriptional regulator
MDDMAQPALRKPAPADLAPSAGGPDFELIELLFFAYRDFVGEPDRLLETHGFGRAHHRVLHFVNRNEGLTVAELLEILEITKQSLARVLKDLVSGGFIEQRAGSADRRQRRLYLTASGRIARALAAADPAARAVIARFLAGLIDPERPRSALRDEA